MFRITTLLKERSKHENGISFSRNFLSDLKKGMALMMSGLGAEWETKKNGFCWKGRISYLWPRKMERMKHSRSNNAEVIKFLT